MYAILSYENTPSSSSLLCPVQKSICCNSNPQPFWVAFKISVVHLTLVCITIYPYLILFHYLYLILLTNMQKHLDYAIPFR